MLFQLDNIEAISFKSPDAPLFILFIRNLRANLPGSRDRIGDLIPQKPTINSRHLR